MRLFSYVLMLVLLGGAFTLSACSSDDNGEDQPNISSRDQQPVEELYNKAANSLDDRRYAQASREFEEVERQHPYSQWATKAQLMSAFAAYKDKSYDEAVLALDRFIQLHPGNEDIDYAYYLRALSFYEQISDVARDQMMTELALDSLETLITRFPDSRYARDATLKRDLTLDHLAGKEMEIGRYYLARGHVNASINRFRSVVKDYQTTTHVPEALHRLVEAYLILGLKAEATRVASVLGYNYPGSKWYEDSFNILDPELREQLMDDRSFVDKTVDSLFRPD
ncbi:MAG: outer membrane protein assembly factor BamD [Pseudomonadota bacterium]